MKLIHIRFLEHFVVSDFHLGQPWQSGVFLVFSRFILTLLAVFAVVTASNAIEPRRMDTGLPVDACGVYAWPGWRPATVNRRTCPLAKGAAIICSWSSLEPQPDQFQFDSQIGDKLRAAVEDD